jgi:hypothetical protein
MGVDPPGGADGDRPEPVGPGATRRRVVVVVFGGDGSGVVRGNRLAEPTATPPRCGGPLPTLERGTRRPLIRVR